MGQCAPSSQLNDSQTSIDEEQVSFIATPRDGFGCHGGLPLREEFSQNNNGTTTKKYTTESDIYNECANKIDHQQQRDFLQVHRPDIPQRCIVDQCEIKRAVWLQSDEILRRQGLLKMHGVAKDGVQIQDNSPNHYVSTSVIENDRDIDQKSMRSEPSTASAMTSTSTSTIVTTNTKKLFALEEKIRNLRFASSRINQSTYTASSLSPSLSDNAINEEMSNFSFNNNLTKPASSSMRPVGEQLNTNRKPRNGNKRDISGQRPIFNSSIHKDPERHECMSMLRLKIKAKVGWFYTQRYLAVFPGELKSIVGTAAKNAGGIPELTCESLDGSFSSICSSDSDHADVTDYVPITTPVKCPVTNKSLFDLAITGSLGLVPRDQDHNALRSSRRQLRNHYERSSNHSIVLINERSGSLLAVCAAKETSSSPVVSIYYTRQIAFAQKPTTTTQRLGLDWVDDLPLYAYAEVISQGEFPDKMHFTVFTANRFDGSFSSQPSYIAYLDGHDDDPTVQSPVMKMVGRTDSERSMSGCALISIQSDEVMKPSRPANFSDLSFHIKLARGIDPAFLTCFTAIVDEILEMSMRIRYKNKIVGRKRKDSFSLTRSRLEARSRVAMEERPTDLPCQVDFCKYTKCNF